MMLVAHDALKTSFRRIVAVVAGAAAIANVIPSQAFADAPKWGAHLDFEGRWGNNRSLGDAGLFAPLWQDNRSLLFTDIRAKFDSQDGREGNFGIGYRHMLGNGWNVGGYGYIDVRRTGYGGNFQQATLGVEALSADWDVRANLYAPFGSRSREAGITGGNPFADFSGGTIQIVTPGQYQILERALTGFDGEIGWRAPLFDVDALTQVRLYGGGFYFDGGGVTRDIAGPRGRVEVSFDGVPGFSSARLTLGAEVQHDDVRGTQGFAIARLRVPLHAEKVDGRRLSAQERRMTERVVRDVDIVSDIGRGAQTSAEVREAAINTWNNQTVTDVAQHNATTQGDLQMALNAYGAGSVVILNGALAGVTATTTVGADQTLIGGGTTLALKGATTGTAVNFLAPGAQGSLSGAVAGGGSLVGVVTLSSGSVAGGLTIGNADTSIGSGGILGSGAAGAVAFGNTITTVGLISVGVAFDGSDNATAHRNTIMTSGIGSHGVSFNDSANGTASGNTITATGVDAAGFFGYNSSLTVRDNAFNAGSLAAVFARQANSFAAGSTGNTVAPAGSYPTMAARCGTLNAPSSGTVFFTDGVNCVYP